MVKFRSEFWHQEIENIWCRKQTYGPKYLKAVAEFFTRFFLKYGNKVRVLFFNDVHVT